MSRNFLCSFRKISTCKSKPPVCIIHGSKDDVVPLALGKFTAKTLKSIGFEVQMHEIENLPHAIDLECVKIAADFLRGNLEINRNPSVNNSNEEF